MSLMSDGLISPNGGKCELMSYVQSGSSHLPPLGGVGASDMIDIVENELKRVTSENKKFRIYFKSLAFEICSLVRNVCSIQGERN